MNEGDGMPDSGHRDLVITWPKSLRLADYLSACATAKVRGEVINYRVAKRPSFDFGAHRDRPCRVYVVHDGAVRGYQELLYVTWREEAEVVDPHSKGFWPAGWYLARDPEWHAVEPVPMHGFQGWRYFNAP